MNIELTVLKDIEMSCRLSNCLNNANVLTVGDVLAKSESDFLKIQKIGRKTLRELSGILSVLGVTWPTGSQNLAPHGRTVSSCFMDLQKALKAEREDAKRDLYSFGQSLRLALYADCICVTVEGKRLRKIPISRFGDYCRNLSRDDKAKLARGLRRAATQIEEQIAETQVE